MPEPDPYKPPEHSESEDTPVPALPRPIYWKLTAALGLFTVLPWLILLAYTVSGFVWLLDVGAATFPLSVFSVIPFVAALLHGFTRVLWYYNYVRRSR